MGRRVRRRAVGRRAQLWLPDVSRRRPEPRTWSRQESHVIGVVVVTHGQLATELVNAAETIVGDLPRFAAVSIGWHDDVELAREEIAEAIARVDSGERRDRADRHVRRDAVEPRDHVSRRRTGRGGHRREPADAAEAGEHARGGGPARAGARASAKTGAPASGSPPTCCAAKGAPDVVIARGHRSSNALWACTRARPRGSCTPATRVPGAGARRRAATASTDGKSIMGILLLAAARGTALTITAEGRTNARRRRRRSAR